MCFRPLIRGFFFYWFFMSIMLIIAAAVSVPLFRDSFFILKGCRYDKEPVDGGFPSPYSGILFLYPEKTLFSPLHNWGFPSPHSGILFLCGRMRYSASLLIKVSVPSFGDSFFINRLYDLYVDNPAMFPSPHSGILFLSCRYDMPPSLNIFAIFRRIRHFLAQKGFPLTQPIHFSPYPSASARIKSFFIHIVPSPIPLNQYIITSSSFISPMPHDLTLVWS